MRIIPENTQAMVIDMQEKLLPVMADRERCEKQVRLLLSGLRVLEIPFLLTQQYTKGLGMSVPRVVEAAGTDAYFDKHTFSCMTDEAIAEVLEKNERKVVLVAGIEAHICVLQTCIDLLAAGYQPVLVTDAITSRHEADREIAIRRAEQEGVFLTTVESLLFELTVDSKHPKFKEISKLIK
jgi:isochorismate hydrolase